jgi:hypothetical protein
MIYKTSELKLMLQQLSWEANLPELLRVGLPGLVELEGDLGVHAEAEVVVHHVQRRLTRKIFISKSTRNTVGEKILT